MRLLMTRPRAASERFVAGLRSEIRDLLDVTYSPLLDIRPSRDPVTLGDAGGLIFTSSNGVHAVSGKIPGRDLPCFCVGAATTAAARAAGWTARMCGETAEELVGTLLRDRPASPLLHLRGEHARGSIAETLTQLGLTTRDQVVYTQALLPLSDEAQEALRGTDPVIIPLFSPRTARQFAEQARGGAPVWIAAMSEIVAKAVENLDVRGLVIAPKPDATCMTKTVENLFEQVMRVEGGQDPH